MITYKLAKQLKEIGFRQDGSNGFITDKGIYESLFNCGYCPDAFGQPSSNSENAYVPTLSELIKACGDRFTSLKQEYDGITLKFFAFTNMMPDGIYVSGSSPEEAVAYLWLELNKK